MFYDEAEVAVSHNILEYSKNSLYTISSVKGVFYVIPNTTDKCRLA